MIAIENRETLTIFTVTGEVTANDIILQVVQYMDGEPTDKSVWDFTQADKVIMTTIEMKGIADSLKKVSVGGKIRKNALVGSKSINIGLGKLFAAFAQMAGLPHIYKVFRDMDHAMAWLDSRPDE